MAKGTIKQRIALDGGEEIRKELAELGRVGEVAFQKLKKAAKDAEVPTTFQANLAKLKAAFADVGKAGNDVGDKFLALRQSGARLGEAFATVGQRIGIATVAASGLAVGLYSVVKAGAESADAIGKAAQKAGLAVEDFQKLEFAASQSGVATEEFVTAMGRLSKALADGNGLRSAAGGLVPIKGAIDRIKDGIGVAGVHVTRFGEAFDKLGEQVGDASEVLSKLGVKTRDATGQLRPTRDILLDLADKFAAMPDGVEKSAAAIAIFGKAGQQLIPFLNSGAKGIQEVGDQLKGLELSPDQIKSSEAMNDSIALLGKTASLVRDQVAALFAPDVTAASDALIQVVRDNKQAILDFAATVRDKGIAVFKDFYNAIAGNGEQVQNKAILDLVTGIKQFGADVQSVVTDIVIPAFESLLAALDKVAGAINSVFGTNLTGQQLGIVLLVTKLVGAFALVGPAVQTAIAAVQALWAVLSLAGTVVAGLAALIGWPALLVAGLIAAGVAIVTFWDQISSGATAAFSTVSTVASKLWSSLSTGAQLAVAAIVGAFAGIAGASLFSGLIAAGSAAFAALAGIFGGMGAAVVGAFSGIVPAATAAFSAIGAAASALLTGAGALAALIGWPALLGAAFATLAVIVFQNFETIKQTVTAAVTAMQTTVAGFGKFLTDAMVSATSGIKSAWDNVTSYISSAVDTISGWIKGIVSSISSAISKAADLVGISNSDSGSSDSAFASGGYVRGPGSGTSDSIRAWLSNGEFVVRAAAVRKYGKEFLAALNAGRLRMPAFARGGLVSAPQFKMGMPAFAAGGLVDGLSNMMTGLMPPMPGFDMPDMALAGGGVSAVINIGGEQIPVTATEDSIRRLERVAARKALASGGRKPGWV